MGRRPELRFDDILKNARLAGLGRMARAANRVGEKDLATAKITGTDHHRVPRISRTSV